MTQGHLFTASRPERCPICGRRSDMDEPTVLARTIQTIGRCRHCGCEFEVSERRKTEPVA